jgi:hypothetical protein
MSEQQPLLIESEPMWRCRGAKAPIAAGSVATVRRHSSWAEHDQVVRAVLRDEAETAARAMRCSAPIAGAAAIGAGNPARTGCLSADRTFDFNQVMVDDFRTN